MWKDTIKMKFYIFKVGQYDNGEGYDGYILIFAKDIRKAMKTLEDSYFFEKLKKFGGDIEYRISSLDEATKHYRDVTINAHELCGDNYN